MSAAPTNCPRCGTKLPTDAPEGLCPRCLGALNFATETGAGGDEPVVAKPPPLTPEQLTAQFPQLEIIECLGRGGMGVVYKARQKSLNRLVALKLLAPERVQDAKFAERFAHEAQALARLSHPNIVTIHDFGVTSVPQTPDARPHPPIFYLLMEFVDGVNLRQLLRSRKLTPEEALAIVPPLCDALQYAHERGIVHRDIKPENLLLDKDGRIKIADFGIAKMLAVEKIPADSEQPQMKTEIGGIPESVGNPAPSVAAGTPGYMAPEQAATPQKVDARADIYSLGVVFYEMLTGELPGAKLQPPSRKVQIDLRLDEIVLRALEAKPELRYATAAEFRTQLETIATPLSSQSEAAPNETQNTELGTRKENQPPILPAVPTPLLKTANAYVSTPEWLASLRGRFWVYTGKGTLVFTGDQLAFTDTRYGSHTTIPLTAIRDVSLGNYPWFSKPVPLHYVSVTWEAAGQTHRRYFTPNQGWFRPVWETNPIVRDWHQALRAAVTAATGKAPTETPAPPHRPTVREGTVMGLLFGMPVVLIVAAFFLMRRVMANAHAPEGQSGGWLLPGLALLAAILPFLTLLFMSRRSRQTSGTPPPPRPGSDTPIWTVLLFSLPFAFIAIFFSSGSQLVAPATPVQPGDGFIPGLLGLAVVIPFLTLYLLPRWGRQPRGSQLTSAPHKPPLWPNFALAAFGAPLLVHLMILATGQTPPEPTHPVSRIVFSFPGTLALAAFAGAGLWLRHRREEPSQGEHARLPLVSIGLALLCVPLVIYLLMLPSQLLLPEPARRGASFPIGFPEAIILAVIGVLGLLRWRQRPAAPASPSGRGRNLFGVGLLCLGMFIGGMKLQEANRDHFQQVQRLTAEIPRLQQQWVAAGNEVFAAQAELNRHIVQEPLARTDAERQRFLIERGRREGEVSQAKVRRDVIQGQIQTTQHTIVSMRFPTNAASALALSRSLPFVLAGLLVLCWPRRGAADSKPLGWKYAGLLMLFLPVLLFGALFLQFGVQVTSLSGVTQFERTLVGVSNNVVIVDVTAEVAHGNAEWRALLTGSALPRETETALANAFFPPFNGTFIKPTPHEGNAAWRILPPGRLTWRLGFVLPDAALAQQAAANLRPIGPLPAEPGRTFAGTLFEVRQTNGQTYRASLQIAPPRTAADPDWVSLSGQFTDSGTSCRLTWEILVAQPGTAHFRREGNYASSSLQLDPKTKFHRATASLELTRVSTNRVRIVTKKGYATSTEELTGNFRELAEELRRHENLSAKTVLGVPIELCRVQGQPLTVTVEAAPPRPAAEKALPIGNTVRAALARDDLKLRLNSLESETFMLAIAAAESARALTNQSGSLNLSPDGAIAFDGQKMTPSELTAMVVRSRASSFTIRADENVPFPNVVELVDALKAVGVVEFSFTEARVGDGRFRVANRTGRYDLGGGRDLYLCRPNERSHWFTVMWPALDGQPRQQWSIYPKVAPSHRDKWAVAWEPGADVLWWVDDVDVGQMRLTNPGEVLVTRESRTADFSRAFGLPEEVKETFAMLGFSVGVTQQAAKPKRVFTPEEVLQEQPAHVVTVAFRVAEGYWISGAMPVGAQPSFGLAPVEARDASQHFSVLIAGQLVKDAGPFGIDPINPGSFFKGREIEVTGLVQKIPAPKGNPAAKPSFSMTVTNLENFRVIK